MSVRSVFPQVAIEPAKTEEELPVIALEISLGVSLPLLVLITLFATS
jgi:hypothetical protein